jgi:hypothetical protein
MFLDTGVWRPKDKAWKAERKIEWGFISNNLKQVHYELLGKTSGYITAHKWLFFEGHVSEEDEPVGGDDFNAQLPFFLFWYHPELTDAVCEQIIDYFSQDTYMARALSDSQRAFFLCADNEKYKKEYGFMGGREELVFMHLMGEKAMQIISDYGHGTFSSSDAIASSCYNGLNSVLRALNSPWHPGQFFWNNHIKPIFHEVREPRLTRYKNIFKMILFFDKHPKTGKDDPHAIALREKLLAEYEAGELPDAMNKLWEEAKAEGI